MCVCAVAAWKLPSKLPVCKVFPAMCKLASLPAEQRGLKDAAVLRKK